jgi:hypothetical protein
MRRDLIGARPSGEGSPFTYVGLETRVEKIIRFERFGVIVNEALAALGGDFQHFITIKVEFAYHNGDEALLKASGRAIC